jgi:hypothetical protein
MALFAASTALTIGIISKNLCLKTISSTCNSVIQGISYFLTNKHESFSEWNKLIFSTDISAKIGQINQIILEFKEKVDRGDQLKKSIQISIMDLQDSILSIDQILNETTKLHVSHLTKYFNKWRTVDCSRQIESLKIAQSILDRRFDTFIKIMSITNQL